MLVAAVAAKHMCKLLGCLDFFFLEITDCARQKDGQKVLK